MPIKSILLLTDLWSPEDQAMHRARLLAIQRGAALKVLHYPSRRVVDAPHALIPRAKSVRLQLEEELGREVKMILPPPGRIDDVLAMEASAADLVVVPHRRASSVAAFFGVQPALRVLRVARRPVLVVRARPGESYGKILVATDLHDESARLIEAAAQLEPYADIELFHALSIRDEAKLRSAEASERAVQKFRETRTKYAQRRLLELTTHNFAGGPVSASIGRGDPGQQIVVKQKHSGADLVIVGKKDASPVGDFFCGSVAGRVLSWGAGDVLVLPNGGARQAVGRRMPEEAAANEFIRIAPLVSRPRA